MLAKNKRKKETDLKPSLKDTMINKFGMKPVLIAGGLGLALNVLIIYIIIHFVAKYW